MAAAQLFLCRRERLTLSAWAFCTAKTRKGLENEILQHESVVSDNPVISCVFVTVPLSLFPFAACFGVCFFIGHTRCPKDYGIPQGLCIGKMSGFPRVSGLQLQTRLLCSLRPPCFFFFNLPGSRASLTANRKRWSQICCETSWSFSGNTSNKTEICCRK